MSRPAFRFAVLLVVVVALGCDRNDDSDSRSNMFPPVRVGESVKIQFRRDALGIGTAGPISPTVDMVGNSEVMAAGEVKEVRSGWILLIVNDPHLTQNGRPAKVPCWIPTSVILMIQQSPA